MTNHVNMGKVLWAIIIGGLICCRPTVCVGANIELIVGVSTGYPPYYHVYNGKLVGVCIDLVTRVARSLDVEPTYRQFPWKRLLLNARKGHVDAIMPLFRTRERETYLYFDNLDLVDEENVFFTWKDADINYSGAIQSMQPYIIGVVAGYSYGSTFDAFAGLNKVVTKDDMHLLQMFQHKRFDVGIGSQDVVMYNARNDGIADQIRFLEPAVTKSRLYIGFSRAAQHGELAMRFSAALRRLKSTKAYRAILEKNGMAVD